MLVHQTDPAVQVEVRPILVHVHVVRDDDHAQGDVLVQHGYQHPFFDLVLADGVGDSVDLGLHILGEEIVEVVAQAFLELCV